MPRNDWSFLNERLANNWLREIGHLAPCSNSAHLNVNGAYYGLYVAEEIEGTALLKRVLSRRRRRRSLQGRLQSRDQQADVANWTRLQQFWDAKDIAAIAQMVDLPNTVLEWAAEAVINDADGYYGGSHNFYIYDEGRRGTLASRRHRLRRSNGWRCSASLSYKQHPIYWWEGQPAQTPGRTT